MSADQISDVALSLEYVKQYGEAHKELNYKQVYLLEQCVVWQRLSVHLGWQCDNVELLMMKFQRQRRTKFSLVQEPLSKKIKDAMNVAVISTLARAGIRTILGEVKCRKCETAKDFQ